MRLFAVLWLSMAVGSFAAVVGPIRRADWWWLALLAVAVRMVSLGCLLLFTAPPHDAHQYGTSTPLVPVDEGERWLDDLALTIQAQSCARDLVRSADMRIVEIAYSPVKGLGLLYPSEVELTALGVASNRRFFLVDEHLQMVNGKRLGKLVQVKPELHEAEDRLTLRFPEGGLVSDVVELGEPVETSFLGRPRPGRLVNGPWGVALSEWAGQPLRLVAPAAGLVGVDRGVAGGVSVASLASLERLAQALGVDTIDRGRFRMLFWIDGLGPHAEDAWVGSQVVLGDAVVQVRGHVGRCVVTTQNPETGLPDLDTLGGLSSYRDPAAATAPLALGVWGEVVSGGRVRLGDLVQVRSASTDPGLPAQAARMR